MRRKILTYLVTKRIRRLLLFFLGGRAFGSGLLFRGGDIVGLVCLHLEQKQNNLLNKSKSIEFSYNLLYYIQTSVTSTRVSVKMREVTKHANESFRYGVLTHLYKYTGC